MSDISTLHIPSQADRRGSPGLSRMVWMLMILGSIGLWAGSIYRAATYPFTHDESLTFAIFHWEPGWAITTNHHLINTWLVELCSNVFGDSEFSWRLPNLAAHALYLTCGLMVLRRFRNPLVQISGFALLNLNPFLLDFFFVARGYGLGFGFQMASFYWLVRAFEERRQPGFERLLFWSALFGALAVLSNWTYLNFYLPLLLVCGIFFFTDPSFRRLDWSRYRVAIRFALANGAFLAFALYRLFRLRNHDELYAGGNTGFVADTIGTLAQCSLYFASYAQSLQKPVVTAVVGFSVGLLLLGIYQFVFRKEVSLFSVFLVMLMASVALPVLQHQFVHTFFPTDRMAVYYLPIFGMVAVSAFDWLAHLPGPAWKRATMLILPALCAAAFGWHFIKAYRTDTCFIWYYDRHTKEALEIVDHDHAQRFPGQKVSIGNSWMLEPAMNYYRVVRNYDWLEPLTRKPIRSKYSNYLYGFEDEIGKLPENVFVRLAVYPDTKTILMRVDRPVPVAGEAK